MPPDEVPDLGQGELGLLVRLPDQLRYWFPSNRTILTGLSIQLLAGHTQLHGQGDQALLGAVVQVALDPTAFDDGSLQSLRTTLGQNLHPLFETLPTARPEQDPSQVCVRPGHLQDESHCGRRGHEADDHNQHRFG